MSSSLPYHVFEGGIAVCRESHNSEGDYTDFFIAGGVMLWGYPKVDGYVPVYLEDLQGEEAILF